LEKSKGKVVRIGGGGGFADDRIDAAVELLEKGNIDYLSFDSLSENELSQIAMKKLNDASHPGYDRMLEYRMKYILPAALKNGVKIISNMGSTNPVAAAKYIAEKANELGYPDIKVAAVCGDNVLEYLLSGDFKTVEGTKTVRNFESKLLAAHAYIPSNGLVDALQNGADIVISGRIGDSAVFMGALRYEFGWAENDWDKLALGIMVGHELECAGQLSGGYFADPPYKIVEQGFKLGFPIAEVYENGEVVFEKVDSAGGVVSVDTCKEQALYEVHDPANYLHADVTVDLSHVVFEQIAKNRVRMTGIKGKPAPKTLKVALGVMEGFFSTTTVWFAGPGASSRAEWAREMLYARFDHLGYKVDALKIFLMGIDGVYGSAPGVPKNLDPWEVGVRVAVRSQDKATVEDIMMETAARMSTNGPASGTCEHASWFVRDVVAYYHTFIPREVVKIDVTYVEAKNG
jgi:hypothetical protein